MEPVGSELLQRSRENCLLLRRGELGEPRSDHGIAAAVSGGGEGGELDGVVEASAHRQIRHLR